MSSMFYLQWRSGTWHAWPKGGASTVCGRVNVQNLRNAPAKQILPQLPPGAPLCGSCTRRRTVRGGKRIVILEHGSDAAAWLAFLRRHLIAKRIKIGAPNERTLAKHLASCGPPTDPKAVAVYNQIRTLLLTPRRQKAKGRGGQDTVMYKIIGLKETLAALPPDATSLQHVANAMHLWRKITGRVVDPRFERYRTETVIETMLAVPNLEAYIIHLHNQGWSSLAQMFHPSTLSRARKAPALRGALDKKTQEYWEQVKGTLNIVED